MMSDTTLCIHEIEGGPVFIAECSPDRIIAINRDRKLNAYLACRSANIVYVLFERELRRVYAYNDQSLVLVFVSPRAYIRQLTTPVNARVGPELNQDYFPAQVG